MNIYKLLGGFCGGDERVVESVVRALVVAGVVSEEVLRVRAMDAMVYDLKSRGVGTGVLALRLGVSRQTICKMYGRHLALVRQLARTCK